MKLAVFIILFLSLLSGISWWAWQDAAPVVTVETIVSGEIKDSAPGRVEVIAKRSQNLKALRLGRVESVVTTPNSASRKVAKGEVIVQLETLDVELALKDIRVRLQAAAERLKAESELALQLESQRRDIEDFRKLTEEGRFPKADFLKKEDALKQLSAKLELENIAKKEEWESYQAKEALTLRHLDDLCIKSPFDGILTEVLVSPGDHVFAGTPLGIMESAERLIRVTLNEEDFQGVAVKQLAAVHFLSHGNEVFHGQVSRISDVLESSAHRRSLFLELDDGNDQFNAGSAGEAEIIKASKKNVTLVPRRALVGNTVCIWQNGVIEVRDVKIGHRNLLTAEVKEGLVVGDRVVVATPHLYRDGQRARLAEPLR
jgi:RND family efflux transporter MFP subunit